MPLQVPLLNKVLLQDDGRLYLCADDIAEVVLLLGGLPTFPLEELPQLLDEETHLHVIWDRVI